MCHDEEQHERWNSMEARTSAQCLEPSTFLLAATQLPALTLRSSFLLHLTSSSNRLLPLRQEAHERMMATDDIASSSLRFSANNAAISSFHRLGSVESWIEFLTDARRVGTDNIVINGNGNIVHPPMVHPDLGKF